MACMTAATLGSRIAPWSGLFAALPGWALHQQLLADLVHYNCHLGRSANGLAAGALIAIVIVIAGWISWRARSGSELRRFIAGMSVAGAALALFAIAMQTLATFILPGCGA
ncbi:MAG TPA: hypothetical protein VF132_10195 [Rudaea sp.]